MNNQNDPQMKTLFTIKCIISDKFYDTFSCYEFAHFYFDEIVIKMIEPGRIIFDFYEYSIPSEAWEDPFIAPASFLITKWPDNICTWDCTLPTDSPKNEISKSLNIERTDQIDFDSIAIDSKDFPPERLNEYSAYISDYLADQFYDNDIATREDILAIIDKQPGSIRDQIRNDLQCRKLI